jgi:hypothetical protein
MDRFINEIILLIKKNWYKPVGCILLNLLVVIFITILLYEYDPAYILSIVSIENKNKITSYETLTIPVFLLITTLLWRNLTSVPKNLKNKVGLIVAIVTENEDEKIRLKHDFIKTFQENINAGNKQEDFYIVEYPEFYSEQITENTFKNFMDKSKAHFIVYGFLKKRLHEGKEHHFFNLNFAVRHAPIPISVSRKFSEEMTQLAPRKIYFTTENELTGFEITTDWITFITEYIIGVAAFITGDFGFSSKLHMKLYNELEKIKSTLPALKKLKDKNRNKLIESLFQQQRVTYYIYRKTNQEELLGSIGKILETIRLIEPKNYGANISRAILLFVKDRNVDKALNELRRVQYKPDDTWRYSEAFLYAYKRDMDRAIRSYKKAFKSGVVAPHIPEESEEFIFDVLSVEPEKYQLWFCLGLINFFAKEDFKLAKDDFETFLNLGNDSEFLEQRRLAKEYLKQIK